MIIKITNDDRPPIPNTLNQMGLNETYRQLKAIGWQSTGQMNPATETSVMRQGDVTISSLHKEGRRNTWLVEVAGFSQAVTGSAEEVTDQAEKFISNIKTEN